MADQRKLKKQTKDKNKNNGFYNSIIAQRAARILSAREDAFERDHGNDTDIELLLYFNQKALMLGHTPRIREIEGWRLLEKRFGSWDRLLVRSGLKPYYDGRSESEYGLVRAEREAQMELHKKRKQQRKIKASKRLKLQEQKKQEQQAWQADHPEARKKNKGPKESGSSEEKPLKNKVMKEKQQNDEK